MATVTTPAGADQLTTREVADLCRVKTSTVRSWVGRGLLGPIGGTKLYRREDAERLAAGRREPAPAEPTTPEGDGVVPAYVLRRLLYGHFAAGGSEESAVALVEWAERAAVAFALLDAAAGGSVVLVVPDGASEPRVRTVAESVPGLRGRGQLRAVLRREFPEAEAPRAGKGVAGG